MHVDTAAKPSAAGLRDMLAGLADSAVGMPNGVAFEEWDSNKVSNTIPPMEKGRIVDIWETFSGASGNGGSDNHYGQRNVSGW